VLSFYRAHLVLWMSLGYSELEGKIWSWREMLAGYLRGSSGLGARAKERVAAS
jgi:hypothetical protein